MRQQVTYLSSWQVRLQPYPMSWLYMYLEHVSFRKKSLFTFVKLIGEILPSLLEITLFIH